MTSSALQRDVAAIPVLVEPAVAQTAEAFVPAQPEPHSAEALPSAEESSSADHPLTDRERAVLAFEKQYWKYSGAKDQAIRDSFEWSPTRYYQVLNALLDRPEAQECEPVLVKRLRRQRATRQRARSGRMRPSPA